jgi:hypothetical protein
MKTAAIVVVVLIFAAAAGALAGCSAGNYKAPATASQPVNSFEQYAYTVLSDVQAGLAETDKKIKTGELPAALVPDYDRAAVLYNTAKTLLVRYDAAYRAGGDVAAVQVEISQDLADLISLGLKLWPQRATAPLPTKKGN